MKPDFKALVQTWCRRPVDPDKVELTADSRGKMCPLSSENGSESLNYNTTVEEDFYKCHYSLIAEIASSKN